MEICTHVDDQPWGPHPLAEGTAIRIFTGAPVPESADAILIQENADLEAEIRDLKRIGDATEERARSELGLIYPDESFFQIAEIEGED